jgi:uncharacterized membrane protein YphA (DoxX/SURF4 family)
MSQATRSRRLATAAYWLVAAEFAMGAVTKFWTGTGPFGSDYAVKFADWGYPPSFRFLVGAIELVCAVLLVVPDRRVRFVGATALVFVLTGAVTTHIVNHDPLGESVAAPVHLLITAAFALANWPADWRDLLPAGLASRMPGAGARPVVRGGARAAAR